MIIKVFQIWRFQLLCFVSDGLTSNQHRLILGIGHHLLIGTIRDGEEMRRHLIPPFTDVEPDHPVGVDGIPLVRVDDNTEEPRVSLNMH